MDTGVNAAPITDLLEALSAGLVRPRDAWQVAVIALSLACAWLLARVARRRVEARLSAAARDHVTVDVLQFSMDGVRRLAFPAAAWLFLWLGAKALRLAGLVSSVRDARLIRLALVLVTALALVRLIVYALRRALVNVGLIGVFERAIALTAWAVSALYVTGVLSDVVDWLSATAIPMGKTTVSLWAVLSSVMTMLVCLLGAMWCGSMVEARLLATPGLNRNVRVLLGRVARAALVVIAVLAALAISGIDLTVLSVFGGALGVGLGLGLQRVASNYVSGFILLLDRSLRIGDLITVTSAQLDRFNGTVLQISTRYTLLKSGDGTQIVVPNELLVASPVVNHSRSDPIVRLNVRLAISYDSDLDLAKRLGEEAARSIARVQAQPPPAVLVADFGPNGPVLEVGFSIADPAMGLSTVKSDVAFAVQRSYQANGIKLVGR